MGDSDPSRQLDLLGVVSGERRHEALAVRWVELDAPGKLGRAAWPGSGTGVEEDLAHLAEHHRVTVLVAVGDAAPLLEAAAARSIGVREISPSERGERLEQQVGALAADLRAGRRAVVVSADASGAALPVACALVRMGRSVEEAARAVDGVLGAEGLEALRAFAGGPAPVGGASEAHDVRVQGRESQKVRLASPLSPRASRMAGAVLGAAIGDAMGHPTEFIRSLDEIRSRYGPNGVEGFELWIEDEGRRVAPYTDDTQMAEVVLRSLLSGRGRGADLDETMREMATRFVSWANDPLGGHRAPGNACLAGCRNLERGVPWQEAGGATAGGCGSVMRAYPFGLVLAHDLGRAEAWAVAHSKLTHRDPIALAACAAMAVGVARVMRDDPVEVVLSEMVAAACRYSPKTAEMMARAIDEALSGVGPDTTLARLEGWAAHEAIAAAVYIFARHPDDPRAAILEGANTPGDSDSLATLAGALSGARAGLAAIPPDWVQGVERGDELLALALRI